MHYLFLILIAFFGFWQIGFLNNPLKWDMIDCFYPWRYFVGDCLQHHRLPLWNPYQCLGYPICADPQSGAWYPVTWFTGYFFGYTGYSLSLEFMLHIFLAGVGMYLLGQTLQFHKNVAFFIAVSYMLSGFFIGNAQHFSYVISGAWVPFVLTGYLKSAREKSCKNALKTGFFLSLLFTGGYPAFVFILGYFLLALFLFYAIKQFPSEKMGGLGKWIKLNGLITLTALVMSSASLISLYTAIPYITRGDGLSLEKVLIGPFSPQCSLSFLVPFSVIKDMNFFVTDLSMTNAYFGLIPLIFFLYSFFIKKSNLMKLFLFMGLFTLAAAFGKYTPVRAFLFYFLPLMNLFKIPSLFRLFAIIGFVVLSGFSLNFFFSDSRISTKKIKTISAGILMILLALAVYSGSRCSLIHSGFLKHDLFTFSRNSSLDQHIYFQSLIQLIVLAVFLALIYKIRDRSKLFNYLSALLVIEMILSAQLNAPYTVYYEQFKAAGLKEQSNSFPAGYPLPVSKNVLDISDSTAGLASGALWKNLNTFHKQTAFDGFNSFQLKSTSMLEGSLPDLFFSTLKNRIVFLSDKLFDVDSIAGQISQHRLNSKAVFLTKPDLSKARLLIGKATAGITAGSTPGDTAEVTAFFPSEIKIKVKNRKGPGIDAFAKQLSGVEIKDQWNRDSLVQCQHLFYVRSSAGWYKRAGILLLLSMDSCRIC